MNHVVIYKAAHHVDDGVGLANVGQKLVAQALARAGTRYQTGNIDKLHNGALHFLRIDNGRQRVQPGIGYFHNAHIGLDGAKRVVFGCNAGLGQGVEKGRFTDVGQAHDAALQTHGNP